MHNEDKTKDGFIEQRIKSQSERGGLRPLFGKTNQSEKCAKRVCYSQRNF